MTDMPTGQALLGKRALVLGIANEQSIAYGCAKVFRALGAELAITYLNEKAKPYVEPLARDLGAARRARRSRRSALAAWRACSGRAGRAPSRRRWARRRSRPTSRAAARS